MRVGTKRVIFDCPQVPPACVSCPNGRRGSRCGFGARPPVEKRIGRRANRRAGLQRVRVDYDPERVMLPVRELREHERLFVTASLRIRLGQVEVSSDR